MRSLGKGLLLCFLPPIFWGAMFPIANSLVPTVNMFATTLIRYGIVAVIMAAMLYLKEGRSSFSLEKRFSYLFWLGTLGFAGFGLLAFTALSYTSPTNVSLIMAMMPAISAIIGAVLSKRLPPAYTIVSILCAFAGVYFVLTANSASHTLGISDVLGVVLALGGAISWVVYTRGTVQFPEWSTLRYTTITTILGVPSIAIATLIATSIGYVEAPTLSHVIGGWLQLLYLIIFAGIMAVLYWNAGNKILGPVNGTLFMNLVPVTTFTITSISAHALPSAGQIIGVTLVVGALIMNNMFMRRAFAAKVG